ncbi:glutathione S-transferase N-terminal domain-containing protein [Methylobacillus glycogenes]|uniref:glutathione S-transferase N-terminal domain-containing protein n=1 Tax=Methylobacillus glycogenes TaxID=406 RepID=UPI0006869D33|nr:glutathione S-transferase N-terminal domain-containing protein [Methylobacillus glycogenes]
MTTLYVSPGACSLGAIVALKALDIPHELVRVALRQPGSPIYDINPLGRVPTLQLDGGEIITENAAILPFLGDLKPEAQLFAPAGSVLRARIQEWIALPIQTCTLLSAPLPGLNYLPISQKRSNKCARKAWSGCTCCWAMSSVVWEPWKLATGW